MRDTRIGPEPLRRPPSSTGFSADNGVTPAGPDQLGLRPRRLDHFGHVGAVFLDDEPESVAFDTSTSTREDVAVRPATVRL